MTLYIISVILASLVQVLNGHTVPVLTVCSSMCSMKRDGSFLFVMCHAPTPNSFRVNTSDQTSILTGQQMIHQIFQEGISYGECVSPKGIEKARIYDIDYEVNTKEAFILDNKDRIFRMRKAIPKSPAISQIRGLRLDQRNKKIYLSRRDVSLHSIVCLSYEGTFLQTVTREQVIITFNGHFDNFGNGVMVRNQGTHRFRFMPQNRTETLPKGTMDVDYDEESVYLLGRRGKVMQRKRGYTANTQLGKPKRASIGYGIAVV